MRVRRRLELLGNAKGQRGHVLRPNAVRFGLRYRAGRLRADTDMRLRLRLAVQPARQDRARHLLRSPDMRRRRRPVQHDREQRLRDAHLFRYLVRKRLRVYEHGKRRCRHLLCAPGSAEPDVLRNGDQRLRLADVRLRRGVDLRERTMLRVAEVRLAMRYDAHQRMRQRRLQLLGGHGEMRRRRVLHAEDLRRELREAMRSGSGRRLRRHDRL